MSENSPNDWIDRRPQQQQLDVGEESLRTQNRESKIAEGSARFVDDRAEPAPETDQSNVCPECGYHHPGDAVLCSGCTPSEWF